MGYRSPISCLNLTFLHGCVHNRLVDAYYEVKFKKTPDSFLILSLFFCCKLHLPNWVEAPGLSDLHHQNVFEPQNHNTKQLFLLMQIILWFLPYFSISADFNSSLPCYFHNSMVI
jgi:hypothetical protein